MKRLYSLMCAGLFGLGLAGCGPAKLEKNEEIKPNETAFVIPLEEKTKEQAKFASVEFLDAHKVAAKRVVLGQRQRSMGRLWYEYEWIPTEVVVRVDRAPVTREWTSDSQTGTSARDEGLKVESLDSINFILGATITCRVEEENTAKFLYFYAGKPIAEIVDTNVRGFIQGALAREFSRLNLVDGIKAKAESFGRVFEEARTFFADKGITIDSFGNTGGLRYDNPNIQTAIDKKFVAEQDIETARQEGLAQEKRNANLLAKATAEASAARALAEAQEAVVLKTDLEIRRLQAEALKDAANRWDGSMPSSILPQGTNLLFGLDLPKASDVQTSKDKS